MSIRWISIVLAAVVIGVGAVRAQESPSAPVSDAVVEQQLPMPDMADPGFTGPPAATDTTASGITPADTTAPDTVTSDTGSPDTGTLETSTMAAGVPAAVTESLATESVTATESLVTDTPPPATVVPAVSSPAPTVSSDDRIRSTFILVSAAVLIATLITIIIILLKRSRQSRAEQRQYAAEAYLRDVSGSTSQGMYKLGSKPVMLGRVGGKDTEFLDYVVVPSATIGRRHALIEFKDFGYWIMDQGSINGTFVNDRLVSSELRLKHGDRIRLHKLEFDFVMPEVAESGVTVLAHDGVRAGASVAAAAPAASDFVLEPEAYPAPIVGGDEMDELRDSVESEEATLLPLSSTLPGSAGATNDETLLPAGGGAADVEETLLPAARAGSEGKSKSSRNGGDDEIFDITKGT